MCRNGLLKIVNNAIIFNFKIFMIRFKKIVYFLSLVFLLPFSSGYAQNTDSQEEQLETDLTVFINTFLQKNTLLRSENSQKLFSKLVKKTDTGLLPEAVYKSLGYRLRDPFISQVPETSTRLYQVSENADLYFQILHDLEKTWALLSTTKERIVDPEGWFDSLVQQNIALDSVHVWYRMRHNRKYNQWLGELKEQVKVTNKRVISNQDEYSESDFGQLNIKSLQLVADNTQLTQFLDTESAYLFVRTGDRIFPEKLISASHQFNQIVLCKPKIDLIQIGNIYLSANYPELIEILKSANIKQRVWQLAQVSRDLSKKLLITPLSQELSAANYALSDLVLRLILQLNHQRLNAYNINKEAFFVPLEKESFNNESRLNEFIAFQNQIFDLMLLDSFIASERIASTNLRLFRGCLQLQDTKESLKDFVTSVQSHYFTGINESEAILVQNTVQQVESRWNGKQFLNSTNTVKVENTPNINTSPSSGVLLNNGFSNSESSNAVSPNNGSSNTVSSEKAFPINEVRPNEESDLNKAIARQAANARKARLGLSVPNKAVPTISSINIDSVIGVSSDQAAALLQKEGFTLSSYQEILDLTSERGYSIQVLTTSSPSEAASVARRYNKSEDVKVYLSSVTIDDVVEKRYKILVTFFAGRVNAEKLQELESKAQRLKGFLKRFHKIQDDLMR